MVAEAGVVNQQSAAEVKNTHDAGPSNLRTVAALKSDSADMALK